MQSLEFFPLPFLIGLSVLVDVGICNRVRGWLYLLGLALFGLYLLAVIAVVFFPFSLPDNWPANLTWKDTLSRLRSVNLIPFNYRWPADWPGGLQVLLLEIGRNILLTVPFGFGAAFLARFSGRPLRGRRLLVITLSAGLMLEGLQLLLKLITGLYIGTVDINDVLLNGLGALIGAELYYAAAWLANRIRAGLKTS